MILVIVQDDFKRHSAHIPLSPPQVTGPIDPSGYRSGKFGSGSPLPVTGSRHEDLLYPHFHKVNGASDKRSSEGANRKSSASSADISPKSAPQAAQDGSEDPMDQRRVRSGSKSSKSSRSSRTSRNGSVAHELDCHGFGIHSV